MTFFFWTKDLFLFEADYVAFGNEMWQWQVSCAKSVNDPQNKSSKQFYAQIQLLLFLFYIVQFLILILNKSKHLHFIKLQLIWLYKKR